MSCGGGSASSSAGWLVLRLIDCSSSVIVDLSGCRSLDTGVSSFCALRYMFPAVSGWIQEIMLVCMVGHHGHITVLSLGDSLPFQLEVHRDYRRSCFGDLRRRVLDNATGGAPFALLAPFGLIDQNYL